MLWDFNNCVSKFRYVPTSLETQPASTNGAQVTSTSNLVATGWEQFISSTPMDSHGFYTETFMSQSGTRTNHLTIGDIGIGASGSETPLLPDIEYTGQSTNLHSFQGSFQYWPVFIPAGSRLTIRGLKNGPNQVTFGVRMQLIGRGSYPFNEWIGTRVTAYGTNPAAATATSVSPSSSASTWGSWTQIVASTTRRHKAFVVLLRDNTLDSVTVFSELQFQIAIGASGSEHVISPTYRYRRPNGTDRFCNQWPRQVIFADIPEGSRLSARCMAANANVLQPMGVSIHGIS